MATPVRTAFVEKGDGHIEIDADGVVVPIREVTLAAEVPGRIMKKSANCRAGKFVKAGTVLFEIDNRDYQLDVARLEENAGNRYSILKKSMRKSNRIRNRWDTRSNSLNWCTRM